MVYWVRALRQCSTPGLHCDLIKRPDANVCLIQCFVLLDFTAEIRTGYNFMFGGQIWMDLHQR